MESIKLSYFLKGGDRNLKMPKAPRGDAERVKERLECSAVLFIGFVGRYASALLDSPPQRFHCFLFTAKFSESLAKHSIGRL